MFMTDPGHQWVVKMDVGGEERAAAMWGSCINQLQGSLVWRKVLLSRRLITAAVSLYPAPRGSAAAS